MEYVRRILVVSEELKDSGIFLRHLKWEGFVVASAPCGPEAFLKVEQACSKNLPFDLIILDMTATKMTGILEWVHENYPAISMILIATYGEMDRIVGSIRPAMDDYDQKPLTPHRMMELIDSVERKRRCTHVRSKGRVASLEAQLLSSLSVSKVSHCWDDSW